MDPVVTQLTKARGVLKRRRRRKESTCEAAAVELVKGRGWLARKMNGLGYRDWPDRLFVPPEGAPKRAGAFWVEFKRAGEVPTPKQAEMHRTLRARGEAVYVVQNMQEFRDAFEKSGG